MKIKNTVLLLILSIFFLCSYTDSESVSINEFGAIPNDGIDDTEAIRNAINSGANTITASLGEYNIKTTSIKNQQKGIGIKLLSNQVLDFFNSTIYVEGCSNEEYAIFTIENIKNTTVKNFSILGEKNRHISTKGEWGMGIEILNSKNINIENVCVIDCWGDGVYISTKSEKIKIKNSHFEGNRRNNISVISGENIVLQNNIFKKAQGINPKSGIDLEPNFENNLIYNIKIENCFFDENYCGVSILGPFTYNVRNINITNCSFHENWCGVNTSGQIKKIKILKNKFTQNTIGINLAGKNKDIQIKENTIRQNKEYGLLINSEVIDATIETNLIDSTTGFGASFLGGKLKIKKNNFKSNKKNIQVTNNRLISKDNIQN